MNKSYFELKKEELSGFRIQESGILGIEWPVSSLVQPCPLLCFGFYAYVIPVILPGYSKKDTECKLKEVGSQKGLISSGPMYSGHRAVLPCTGEKVRSRQAPGSF